MSADRCQSRLAAGPVVLRCQDAPGHAGNHVTVHEKWGDDHPDTFVDDYPEAALLAEELLPAGVETLPPYEPVEHAACRQRTDAEHEALANR